MTEYRPFLVADRPASLRMIRGATLEAFEGPCGIMTHANVSENVKNFVREFPSSDGFYPHNTTSDRKQEYEDEGKYVDKTGTLTPLGEEIQEKTVCISDSGVFTKDGSDFSDYSKLFETYEEMEVDYGIMIDHLNDPIATIESAQDALGTYEKGDFDFNLIGVAQGTTVSEYLECYDDLRAMGFNHIAIGGLLESHGDRGGAFASVSDDEYMQEVLQAVRNEYPDDWLFALGCHHPSRREMFNKLDLYGSDYKGWIYKYNSLNERGTVAARSHRYRNIRSFIRNNILSDATIPVKQELSTCVESPDILVLIAPPASDISFTSKPGPIIEALSEKSCNVYRETTNQTRKRQIATALIWTPSTGLVPEDFRVGANGTTHRTISSEREEEEIRIDLQKFIQYRSFDEVLLVSGGNQLERFEDIVLEEVPSEIPFRVLSGNENDRAKQLQEKLATGLSELNQSA